MKRRETEKQNELSVTPRGAPCDNWGKPSLSGYLFFSEVESFSKWKTRPQQVGEGNAPNELISGFNAQSAGKIHPCHSKATSGKCYKITNGRPVLGSLNFK